MILHIALALAISLQIICLGK